MRRILRRDHEATENDVGNVNHHPLGRRYSKEGSSPAYSAMTRQQSLRQLKPPKPLVLPMFNQRALCRVLLSLLALIPLYGCASTPQVLLTRWQPVEFDVEGVDSLAVLTFGGKGEPAERARALVLEELDARGFYTLVDEATARNLGAGSAYLGEKALLEQAVAEARRLGIDALLAAKLRGRLDTGAGILGGAFRTGDPIVAVRLSYDLIHVPTGRILAQQTIVREYQGELAESDGRDSMTDQVAQRLVRECTDEMVADITAHPETFEVTLADGSWGEAGSADVERGNEAAEDGEWREAIDHWHAALQANPQSHAAMYNLGVAFEQAADMEGAAGWYAKAAAENDQGRYQDALNRLEAGRQPFLLAQSQVWRTRRPAIAVERHQFVRAPGPVSHPIQNLSPHGGRMPRDVHVAMPPTRGGRF